MKTKIFISSTYYDLRYLRERIYDFLVNDYGFEAVAFEEGDVTYSPKQSMIKSCFSEIGACHGMILLIGSKYGSTAMEIDANTSVTRGEYVEGMKHGLPIYIFVEKSVFDEFLVYEKNSDLGKLYNPTFVDNIRVFDFINDIKQRGNIIQTFTEVKHITQYLKKQWSGNFSEYLLSAKYFSSSIISSGIVNDAKIESPKYYQFKDELEHRANAGDTSAQFLYGTFHLIGNIYYKKDVRIAFTWIELSAKQKYVPAINSLANMYYRGAGVPQSYTESFKYIKMSAESGNLYGMGILAFHYRHGIGCKRNIDEALYWYETANAKQPNLNYVNQMGETYEWIGDYKKAAIAYKEASNELARASYNLAKLYHRKLIDSNNHMALAIEYYEKASDKGWTEAKATLGTIYFQGSADGVVRLDFKLAEQYLSEAANAGMSDPQYILAYMYEYGLGVVQSEDIAINYYTKAALQGHSEAQFELGQILLDRRIHRNSEDNDDEIFKWISKAATQGYLEAKRTLIDMYSYGIGCRVSFGSSNELLREIDGANDELYSIITSIYQTMDKELN